MLYKIKKNQCINQYTIIKKLGEGRFGKCFLVVNEFGEKRVIKKIKKSFFGKIKGDKIESVILSRLKHTKIPNFFEIIENPKFYGYVIEFIEGDNLEKLIFKEKRKFSKKEFFIIGKQLIEIIEYLHINNIVHRDIRLPNLILNKDMLFLIDFGLARVIDNIKYVAQIDFTYLGDVFLYILYTDYDNSSTNKAWYNELDLSHSQNFFLKKLMGIEVPYNNIKEVYNDFIEAFDI